MKTEDNATHAHDTGEKWADFLNLKKSPTHADRYQMRGGDKTATGVYNTLKRLIREDGKDGLL